ncbi:MAG: hypothetical protein KatS3mg007_0462 [Thermoanaerobaculum sp.]|nr:MAG: hypothetical protein KatS3mg007_0462 [Thermoanaerobaculum sp.]
MEGLERGREITNGNLGAIMRAGCVLMMLIGALVLAAPAGAVTYTVTTLSDTVSNDGQCSLREAIQEANNGADTDCTGSPSNGNDTITFSVSGTIALGSTLPNILDAATVGALTINGDVNGDGIGDITISGNNTVRVMWVDAGGDLTLRNLTMANGNAPIGAGIANVGTLTVTNSTFSGNSASSEGGGIWNAGALNVTNSTFSGNSAANAGGGIVNGGTLNVTNSTFSGNSATNLGGGIANAGTLTVAASNFYTNTAGINGGALFNDGGTLNLSNSIVLNNSAANSGGGIYNLMDGTVRVTGSTFSANSAANGGGILNGDGSLYVTNSTFAGNTATNYGGGIRSDSWLNVTNSTLSNNAATSGGGIYVTAGSWATIKNTIIANSTSGGDCAGTLSGSNINNLIEDSTNVCGLINGVDGNIIGVDPNLGPLTGSPAYFPLVFPSAAIDAGDPTTCSNAPVSNQSQNGVTRPQDGDANGSAICDIGSFEAPAPVADMSAWVDSGAVGPGQTITGWQFSCGNSGPDPAINATCSISASAGTISNINCSPAVPVASLASGASITCTFDFTAPGAQGGGDTTETSVTFIVTTGANNDSDPFNNFNGGIGSLVDALDESASFPANTNQSYNVGSNDQYDSGSLPAIATFSLQPGTNCPSANLNGTTGLATFDVPPSGTCMVVYQACVFSGCDTAQLTVTAQVGDMAAALGSLPVSMEPGGSYTSLSFSCTNNGPDPAVNATCSISASAGSVSNVSCSPAVPVGSLANGASISCTFDFTAPGTAGGSDTPETGVTFTVATGADNDSSTANNTTSNASPVPLVDALDDTASFPGGSTASYNVASNDQFGSGNLPAGASFSLLAGTTCTSGSIDNSGVATFDVPASGSCVVLYQVCVGAACDSAQLTVTAQVGDMAAALGSLPPSLSPGGSYTSLSFSCTNNGPDPATNATCSITASAGTVSGVSCNPPVPVGSLANGATINCTFNFTAPGISGGGDTPQTGVTFTVTAGASNDSNAANNTASNTTPVPLVDALDDSTSFPASFVGATFNVGSNDQFGSGSLPPGASFTLLGATTCASASINSSGVATFNVPASGTCVVAYRVCVISGCDNAQLVVTVQQEEPIPTLDEWGFAALVLLMVGAGLLLVRRVVA